MDKADITPVILEAPSRHSARRWEESTTGPEAVKPGNIVDVLSLADTEEIPAHYSKQRVMVGGRLFEGLRPFVVADVEGRLDEIQAKVMDGIALTPDELVIIAVAGKEVE